MTSFRERARLLRLGAGLLMAGLSLAGCKTLEAARTEAPAPEEERLAVLPQEGAASAAAFDPASPQAPEEIPPPPPEPKDFLGLTGDALSSRLGAPSLKRREPPAEVWQFAAPDCVLHVFLYPSGDDAQMRVDHIEARPRNGATDGANRAAFDSRCLALLIARDEPASASAGAK